MKIAMLKKCAVKEKRTEKSLVIIDLKNLKARLKQEDFPKADDASLEMSFCSTFVC